MSKHTLLNFLIFIKTFFTVFNNLPHYVSNKAIGHTYLKFGLICEIAFLNVLKIYLQNSK